jgi:hypothetical protein
MIINMDEYKNRKVNLLTQKQDLKSELMLQIEDYLKGGYQLSISYNRDDKKVCALVSIPLTNYYVIDPNEIDIKILLSNESCFKNYLFNHLGTYVIFDYDSPNDGFIGKIIRSQIEDIGGEQNKYATIVENNEYSESFAACLCLLEHNLERTIQSKKLIKFKKNDEN